MLKRLANNKRADESKPKPNIRNKRFIRKNVTFHKQIKES